MHLACKPRGEVALIRMLAWLSPAAAAEAPLVWDHTPPAIATEAQVVALEVVDGRVIFAGMGEVEAWSLATKRRLWRTTNPLTRAVVEAPGGALLAVDDSGDVALRDLRTGDTTRRLGRLASWPLAAAVSPDGRYAAAVGLHGELGVWTLADGAPVAVTWAAAPTRLEALAFAGDLLFVGGILEGASPLGVVDLRTGAGWAVPGLPVGGSGYAVATDGHHVALGRFGAGELSMYAADDGLAPLWTQVVSPNWAGPLVFADGALLVGTPEGLLRVDPASGQVRARFPLGVGAFAVAGDEVFAVPMNESRLLRLRLADLTPLDGEEAGPVGGLAWSPDGRRLAVQTMVGVEVYDARGARIDGWQARCASLGGIRFDATGQRLATQGCSAATIATVGGPRRVIPTASTAEVWFDGDDVVIAPFDGPVLTEAGRPARDPRRDPALWDAVWGHRSSHTQHWFNIVRFGDDRQRWISGGFDLGGVTTVERRTEGVQLRRGDRVVPLAIEAPSALAVSPDGRRLAVGYRDGRVEVRALP